MKINGENTGSGSGHSINCACYDCTGGDSYLAYLKNNVGKNAAYYEPFGGSRFAARPGVYGSNHADSIIKPISTTAPAQTVVQSGGKDWVNLLGSLGTEALGIIMQKQQAGTLTDPTLNQIGKTANQIAQAGVDAGIKQTEATVGQNVVKFSPWIIGGIVLLLGALVFLIARKS